MKPYIHAQNSVKRYGGKIEDYLPIHDFFDSTKATWADTRHRAILHNTFGIFIVEKIFGTTLTNSDGKIVQVRDIGEDHVMEDCGGIPTVEAWLKDLPPKDWMRGKGQEDNIKRVDLRINKKRTQMQVEVPADYTGTAPYVSVIELDG